MQSQKILLFIQEFIYAIVTIGLEKACLVELHSKGKPSNVSIDHQNDIHLCFAKKKKPLQLTSIVSCILIFV